MGIGEFLGFGLKTTCRKINTCFHFSWINISWIHSIGYKIVFLNIFYHTDKFANILFFNGSFVELSLGEMDLTNKTFVLKGNVTPKEHQPGVTEAFLTVNEAVYPMELINGAYSVQVDLPLFEEARVDKVEFHEGDVIRTETLDEQWSPRYRFLPQVSGRLSGSGRGSGANGVYTWHREGEVRINIEGKTHGIDVRSVALVEVLDGVEVARTEIPLSSTERNRKNNVAPEPVPPTSSIQINGTETFYYLIDREFNIPFGSTLELLAEVVDGNGLRYRTVLEHWTVSESGENVDDGMWGLRDLFEQILDADGNVLYEVDESDYR